MTIRDELFNNKTDNSDNGPYSGWDVAGIDIPAITTRTVFYDSNIAFTNGNAGISNENTKTVPNLYDTLVGLNTRINNINTGSINGIETYVDENTTNVIMSAVYNSNPYSLIINANDISFAFNNGARYSMQDIFAMLEELRARTQLISTNVARVGITSNYIENKQNVPGDLWTENLLQT